MLPSVKDIHAINIYDSNSIRTKAFGKSNYLVAIATSSLPRSVELEDNQFKFTTRLNTLIPEQT